jgi:hypothetical protein
MGQSFENDSKAFVPKEVTVSVNLFLTAMMRRVENISSDLLNRLRNKVNEFEQFFWQ